MWAAQPGYKKSTDRRNRIEVSNVDYETWHLFCRYLVDPARGGVPATYYPIGKSSPSRYIKRIEHGNIAKYRLERISFEGMLLPNIDGVKGEDFDVWYRTRYTEQTTQSHTYRKWIYDLSFYYDFYTCSIFAKCKFNIEKCTDRDTKKWSFV